MAKNTTRRQKGPIDVLMKKAPILFSEAIKMAVSYPTRLCSTDGTSVLNSEIDKIAGGLGSNLSQDDVRDNIDSFSEEIEVRARNLLTNTSMWSKFVSVKEGSGEELVFTIKNLSETGGMYTFFKTTGTLPGSKNMPATASTEQLLTPLFEAIKAIGFTGASVSKTRQNLELEIKTLDEVNFDVPDKTLIPILKAYSKYTTIETDPKDFNTAVYKIYVGLEIDYESSDLEIDLGIKPYVVIKLSKEVLDEIVDTDDNNTIPFLSLTWVSNAVKYGMAGSSKRWDSGKTTDLRKSRELLNKIVSSHGKIRPRVNDSGFAVSGTGLPIYIPEVDLTSSYMKTISSVSKDEDGRFNYEDVSLSWANKIISVDWFNDVLTYTDHKGDIKHIRMLGYVKLNPGAEYVLLNSPLHDKILFDSIKTLSSLLGSLVTAEEAINVLPNDVEKPATMTPFGPLLTELMSTPLDVGSSDPEYQQEDSNSVRLKHLFGVDLKELGDQDHYIRKCHYAAAYFRVLNSKKKDFNLDPLVRLKGVEYLLHLSEMTPEKFERIKEKAIKENRGRKQQPLVEDLLVPNLDAGGNLKGYMPQQVRALSNMQSNSYASLLSVDPGGGKTLLGLAGILLKYKENPKHRALVVTKPRLVAQYISEINFFTNGKVNVVSLRIRNLIQLRNRYGIDTFKKLLDYINSMPDNTIFICGYTDFTSKRKIYDDLLAPERMLDLDVSLTQFLHIIRMLSFEITKCDESHLIKNRNSLRSEYTYSAMSYSENKILATGTFIPDTVLDMVGQGFSINPMIFGDSTDSFKDRFGLTSGIIKDDEQAAKINARLNKFLQTTTAYKEDWAFVLPDLHDSIETIKLTPKQSEFYNQLLKTAEMKMKEMLEKKKDALDDEEFDEDDDEDERFMGMADASLSEVEQFIVAPDENKEYVMSSLNPSGDDLVSPLVRLLDTNLLANFSDPSKDFSKAKAAVFGINKVASLHILKHSKFANRMIHYTSGNEEAIRKFKTDPDVWILAADSTSLREGENLQMLSYCYDTQAPWRPGDFEQLVSRMYRPDPKGIYNKDTVAHKWLMVERADGMPSVNGVKLARMISKAVSVARLRYSGDPRWEKTIGPQLEGLELLKMNLELLFHTKPSDVGGYLQSWAQFNKWLVDLNKVSRLEAARKLELENPGVSLLDDQGRVIDRNVFMKMVMREAKPAPDLPGSRKAFQLWEPGATPPDPYNMELTVVGSDPLEPGEYVMTELGPAIVHKVTVRAAIVEVYGMKKIKLGRRAMSRPASQSGKNKLAAMIKDPAIWRAESEHATVQLATLQDLREKESLSPIKDKLPTRKNKRPENFEPDNELEEDISEDLEMEEISEIYVLMINSMPALGVYENVPKLKDLGWREINDYIEVGFRTWALADQFVEMLSKRYYIRPQYLEQLEKDMDSIRDGKSMKLTKRVAQNQIRHFFLEDHKKLPKSKDGRIQVKPYVMATDRKISLAFSIASHPPAVVNYVKRMANKNSGILKPKVHKSFYAKVFNTIPEAAKDIKALARKFDLPQSELRRELRELKEDIRDLRVKRNRPSQKS